MKGDVGAGLCFLVLSSCEIWNGCLETVRFGEGAFAWREEKGCNVGISGEDGG